jgi:sterol desaturase/sphingolipid hydroxylase (fatty acid hydroxylase superfamily)
MNRKTLWKWLAFPAILVPYIWILLAYPGQPLPAYAALVAAIGAGILLERVIPYSRRWLAGDDWTIDIGFAGLAILLAPLVSTALTVAVAGLADSLPAFASRWTAGLSLSAQVPLALVASGFVPYVLHRIAHESGGFLWRAHAVHHAPERLYWLNALRMHPVNVLWNVAGSLLPLLLLGFDREAIFIAGMFNNLVAFLNHMNVDFRLGPLNYVFNMGELHRWHHSRVIQEANTNYSGGALCLWDLLLGTLFLPRRSIDPRGVGLFEDSSFPARSYVKQLLLPFCRCGAAV